MPNKSASRKATLTVSLTTREERSRSQTAVNYARAAELGVSTEALGQVVRVATSGDFSTRLPKLNLPQRQIPIRVQFDCSDGAGA